MLYPVIQAVGTAIVAVGGVLTGKTNLKKLGWAILSTGIVVFLLASAFNAYEQERGNALLHETISDLRDRLYDVAYARPRGAGQTLDSSAKLPDNRADRKTASGTDGAKATSSINEHLKILSPSDNGTVSRREAVHGVVSNPADKLWLVVHPVDVPVYWVQPGITVDKDGSWETTAYFGRAVDVGKRFEIMVLANPQKELKEADALDGWPKAQWTSSVIEVIRK